MKLLSLIISAATLSPLAAQTVVFHVVPEDTVIAKLFEQSGCTGPSLEEQPVKRVKIPNLICTLSGQSDSRILVTAHTDHVNAGDGTADNWSGASMLPDLYESLRTAPRRHTFVFIGFTPQEEGLTGSRFYATAMIPSCQSGPGYAAGHIAAAAELPIQAVNVQKVGESDAEAFAGLHIRSIRLRSVTQQTLEILHSDRDTSTRFTRGNSMPRNRRLGRDAPSPLVRGVVVIKSLA